MVAGSAVPAADTAFDPSPSDHSAARKTSDEIDGGHRPSDLMPMVAAEDEESLNLGVYLSWVKNEMDNENACLELPFTIILLISFSCLAYLHLNQSKVFAVERALRLDIEENANFAWSHNFGHKTVFDVNSIADFWSWLRIGFLPLLVQHSWSYSEGLQEGYAMVNASYPFSTSKLLSRWALGAYGKNSRLLPVRDDYLHHHRLVGGVRLRQERSRRGFEFCRMPGTVETGTWQRWLGKPCLPAEPAYELTPEPTDAEDFQKPERVEWLLTARDSLEDLRATCVDMEDGCSELVEKGRSAGCLCRSCVEGGGPAVPWFDEQVQRIEIGFLSYNSEYGLFSLVTVNFFVNRGGFIHKKTHVQSSWANDFERPFFEKLLMVTCDLVWILSLTYVLVCEVLEVIKSIRSSKQRWYRSLWEYVGIWNAVDWVSIGCAYFLVAMYVRLYLATGRVNRKFETLAKTSVTTRAQYISMSENFFDMVEWMCSCERNYRLTFTSYPMVVMARLLKSFHAQPRLAVVTRTLISSASDMTHFFIVFLSCYFCMTVNGILLFGQDVEDFATLDRAIISCWRGMFGDWDNDMLQKVGLFISALWLWIFVIIIPVILLNMLLAILMDAYTEVKSNATDSQTLFKQISEILRRRRDFLRGKRVRLTDIWKAFFNKIGDEADMLNSEERMTPALVLNMVPGMKMDQAVRTLTQAKLAKQARNAVPYTQDNVKESVDALDSRTRLIVEEITEVRKAVCLYDDGFGLMDFSKGHAPQMQVVDAVRGMVGELSGQLEETLSIRAQRFETHQGALAEQQQELVVCAVDSHSTFQHLRARSDAVAKALHRQLEAQQLHRMRRQLRSAGSGGGSGRVGNCSCSFASCGNAEVMAPQHLD